MNILWKALCGASLFVCCAAHAAPLETFRTGNWFAGAYSDDRTGEFSHCAMSTSYQSGILMVFSVGRAYQWAVSFADEAWKLNPGANYPLALYIDGTGPIYETAVAITPTMVSIGMASNAGLFEKFRHGYQLRVQAAGQTFLFNLDGTAKGLNAILACTQSHVLAAQRGNTANPFAAAPTTPGTDRNAARAEATALAANLLSQAGITGFQILTPDATPKAFAIYDVVWTAPGVVGEVSILAPGAVNGQADIAPRIIANDAEGCAGKFASGSSADVQANKSVQLFTSCENSQGSYVAYYFSLPRPAGGFYVFGTISTGADSDKADEDGKGIRSVALRTYR